MRLVKKIQNQSCLKSLSKKIKVQVSKKLQVLSKISKSVMSQIIVNKLEPCQKFTMSQVHPN